MNIDNITSFVLCAHGCILCCKIFGDWYCAPYTLHEWVELRMEIHRIEYSLKCLRIRFTVRKYENLDKYLRYLKNKENNNIHAETITSHVR
jgi:hypothetical protein